MFAAFGAVVVVVARFTKPPYRKWFAVVVVMGVDRIFIGSGVATFGTICRADQFTGFDFGGDYVSRVFVSSGDVHDSISGASFPACVFFPRLYL